MRRLALTVALVMVCVSICALSGCKKKSGEEGRSRSPMVAGSTAMEPAPSAPAPAAGDHERSTVTLNARAVRPKIIMTAEASIRSTDLVGDLRIIRTKIQDLGGYVASSTQDSKDKLNRAAHLSIKIPSENFDDMMAFIETRFTVENIRTDSEDVSEEYVDVESRVANLRVEEQGLVNLLANRSGKLDDMLTVARELSRVRGEIEGMQGRLRYLDNRVGYSVINLALEQPAPPPPEEVKVSWVAQAGADIKASLIGSVMVLGSSAKVVLVIVAAVLPFAAAFGLMAVLALMVRKLARTPAPKKA